MKRFAIVTLIVALVPAVGAGSVVLAAAAIMYLGGHSYAALFLVLWGILAVGLIDNVVKPYAMGHGSGLPSIVLLFGIAGGLTVYGPLGLFLGPAIIAVFAALLRVYSRTYMVRRREAA